MADLRSIGTVVELYEIDNSFYPVESSETDLTSASVVALVEPLYIQRLPVNDGWRFSFRFLSTSTTYTGKYWPLV